VHEFRILGPLEVTLNGTPVPLTGRNQRSLLTLLLLRANEVVSAERLVAEMWGEAPPRTATTSLQNTVSQLRKVLGAELLVTRPPGYMLAVAPDAIDLGRFERLLREARGAVGPQRARLLREALGLWRGPALAGADPEFAELEARRLEELRLAATEEWVDAELDAGSSGSIVAEVEALVRENPLRERLRGQLMLALYRAGRQADALRVYHEGRRVLVDELGIEPGRALQQLYAQILRQERVLDRGAPSQPLEDAHDDSDEVWRAILAGRLVPVLGAGVALDGAVDLRERAELAAHLARTFDAPPEHLGDLAKVAQYIVVTRGIGPLYDELHAIFDRDFEPRAVHRFLAELPPLLRAEGAPQQLIVSTQYDCALEQAFDIAGEPYDVVSYISVGRDRGKFLHRSAEGDARVIHLPNAYSGVPLERRPVILKIHGAVDREPARASESFVISEDDHISYLAESGLGGALPVTLAARLRRSHFLFLGYGLLDWTLRVFLHRLWPDGQADYRSWAAQPSSGAIEREFWKRRGVEPSGRDLDDFVALLRARLDDATLEGAVR
jgi:DNA-binding SARP family transcriptional activator